MVVLEKIHLRLTSSKKPLLVEVVQVDGQKVLLRCGEMLFWAKDNSKKVLGERFWATVDLIDEKVVIKPLPFKV